MNNTHPEKGKVMIVDDNDNNRTLLSLLLESEGWQITEAHNGKEALTKLAQEQPQILVLDHRMPELSGVTLYQYLREQDINIPIVLMTAYSEIEPLALSLGIRYFLKKPFDSTQLLATIESAYQEAYGKA